MSASAGKKMNNGIISGSTTSWEDKWQINAGGLTNATRLNLIPLVPAHVNGDVCWLIYTGTAALTLSEFNNLPTGSLILDFYAKKIHMKTAATTWVSSAAMS